MSTTPISVNRPAASTLSLGLLCACFALSGIAALIYQTAWTRQFAIVFGTSELAVATVLAAYMGGLAFGAWLAERYLPRVTRPVVTYALLEIGIAVSAVILVPLVLWGANHALVALFGGQPVPPSSDHASTTLFYLLSAFVALALPTTLMGATLPMLARYAIGEESQIGRRIGVLYATNTAGAVVGALLTAFLLLPEFGLEHTIWTAAGINGAVFLLAAELGRRVSGPKTPQGYDTATPPVPPPRAPRVRTAHHRFGALPGPAWVLPLMLLAGAVAFFQEVLWTRMLSHVVGSSVYAFGVMVASFLVGISLGGFIGAALARTRERASLALGIALMLAAAAAAVAYLNLERLMPQTAGLLRNSLDWGFVHVPLNVLFSGLLLLPMTLAIGVTYPLAVRVLAHDTDDAAPASARVYTWNTVGAIVGSLAAGFVLIPALKYEGAIRVAVYASAALGVVALWSLVRTNRIVAGVLSVVAIGACVFFVPRPPLKLVITSPLNVDLGNRVLYYDVGRSASVVMLGTDGGLALRTNGLPEALMDGPGSLARFSGEFWMSPLAVIARPKTRDMLIVGLGGGSVIEGVPPSVEHVDVIELEPKVIVANRETSSQRRRDPLADPRVTPIVNDARGALRLTNRRYDAIISQPSHPWTAGASHLYTREFMQLARDHLTEDGVFVQWMNVIFLDEDLLRSLTATLLAVFPEVRVYRPDPNTMVFLASAKPLELEKTLAATGQPLIGSPLHYARFGINGAEDLLVALALDTEGARQLASGSPIITDDDNRIAMSNVYEELRGMTGETCSRVLAGYDPVQRNGSTLLVSLRDQLSISYLVRRNSVFGLLDPTLADRTMRIALALGPGPDAEIARAAAFRLRQNGERANQYLRLAIDQYPDNEALRLEFLRPHFGELATGTASPEILEVASPLKDLAALTLETARHASKNEWQAVAAADSRLAEAPWTYPWYPEITEMRANWRSRVREHGKRFGDEAITLIDRVAVLSPSLSLYGLRARSGFTAGRPAIVVESVAGYAKLAMNMVRAGYNSPDALRQDKRALLQILDDAAKQPGVDAVRLAEVRGQLDAIPSN